MLIRDNEDNKPRIIVDKSKGFPELETVHPIYFDDDMEKIRRNTNTKSKIDIEDVFTEMAVNSRTTQD